MSVERPLSYFANYWLGLIRDIAREIKSRPKMLAKKIHRKRQSPIGIRLAIRFAAMARERMIRFGIFARTRCTTRCTDPVYRSQYIFSSGSNGAR